MIEKIGTFLTKSSTLRISDPCYDKSVWCCGTIKNCKIGEWSAFIIKSDEGSWGIRNSNLVAIYGGDISIKEAQKILDESKWKNSNISVGVDSGQCGIFDDIEYPEGDTGQYGDYNTFYGKCCKETINKGSDVIDFGVVSRAGYGDGTYKCLISDKTEIDAIRIIYIDEVYKNLNED